MTSASGFRAAGAGRSGVPLRLVLAHGAGVAGGSALRVRAWPGRPVTPASGFRAAGAGCSGLQLRLWPAHSGGGADGYAMRAARPGDVTALGRPCESGEIEDGRSGP